MLRIFFLLCTLVSSPIALADTWDLNDVSFLFPVPTSSSDSTYLKAQDFMPFTWFTQNLKDSDGYPYSIDSTLIGPSNLAQFTAIATKTFNNTRLLAVRIDPCFRDLFSDPCRMQVRAIWQPMDQSFSTVDATMHTFYDLNADEFAALVTALKGLKTKYHYSTTGVALQVHPGFQKAGFSKDLFAILKTTLRQDHLTRIAFMKLLGTDFQWRFQGFNVRNGSLVPMQIPVHTGTTQTFAIHGGGIPPGTLDLSEAELASSSNGEQLEKILLDYSLRIENPTLNIPGTTDCLSCHASSGVKGDSAAVLGVAIPTVANYVALTGSYNLKNTSNALQDRIHFRGFGYVAKKPSISDRVIIESAMVADAMNRALY